MSALSPEQERKDWIATRRFENRCDELESDGLDLAETLIGNSESLTKEQLEAVGDAILACPQAYDIIRALAAADTEGVEDEP